MDGIAEDRFFSGDTSRPKPGFFDRESTVAGPDFNRWLVPTAALAIHLCIGMAYGFSVFWLPMANLVAGADPVACADISFFQALTTTSCNWAVSHVTYTFGIFIAMLGISAALWGAWHGTCGPSQGRSHSRPLLGWWHDSGRCGCDDSPALAAVPRLRCAWWYRPGAGLHYAGFDVDQVVPGSPWYGNRFRDYGLRWRSHGGRASGSMADGAFLSGRWRRCCQHSDDHGGHLFLYHDGGSVGFSGAS